MPFIFFHLITTLCTVIADVLRKRKSRITKSFCPELKFSPSCVSGTGRKCYLEKWKTKMSFIHIALLQETKNVIEWSEWRENVLTKQGPNYQNYSIIATLISCNKLSNPQRLTKELTYTCRWKMENENWFQIYLMDLSFFVNCISWILQDVFLRWDKLTLADDWLEERTGSELTVSLPFRHIWRIWIGSKQHKHSSTSVFAFLIFAFSWFYTDLDRIQTIQTRWMSSLSLT